MVCGNMHAVNTEASCRIVYHLPLWVEIRPALGHLPLKFGGALQNGKAQMALEKVS